MLDAPGGTPATIGPYRIRSVLGQGGMGVVYLAERADLGSLIGLFAAGDPLAPDAGELDVNTLLERGIQRAEALAAQPEVQAQMLNIMGRVPLDLSRYDRADSLRRALELRRRPGTDPVDVAESLGSLGRLFAYRGQNDSAEVYLGQALALVQLGGFLHRRGDHDRAEAHLREALEINTAVLGPEHTFAILARSHLALTLRDRGEQAGRIRAELGVASATWKEDAGVIERTGFDKQGARVNLDQDLGDRVRVQLSTNLLRTLARRGVSGNDNSQVSPWFAGLSTPRFVDLRRRPDGTYPVNPFAPSNPLQTLGLLENDEEVWRFIGSGRLEIDAVQTQRHTLRLIGTAGVDRFSQENSLFSPPEMQFEPLDVRGPVRQGRRHESRFPDGFRQRRGMEALEPLLSVGLAAGKPDHQPDEVPLRPGQQLPRLHQRRGHQSVQSAAGHLPDGHQVCIHRGRDLPEVEGGHAVVGSAGIASREPVARSPLRPANVSARNPLTFTDYTGMDPEVSNFGHQAVGRNVDVAAYPRTRTFWFGIDLGF